MLSSSTKDRWHRLCMITTALHCWMWLSTMYAPNEEVIMMQVSIVSMEELDQLFQYFGDRFGIWMLDFEGSSNEAILPWVFFVWFMLKRFFRKIIKCQWFSGKIQRCHRWAPSSILGWRSSDTVAEWLRRLTRNQLGLSRAGSSPVSVVFFTNIFLHKKELHTKLKLHLLFFSPSLELVLFLC